MKVLILGSGFSAAFAYRAAQDLGHSVTVVSRKKPSFQFIPPGAIWFHSIPESIKSVQQRIIGSFYLGDRRMYLKKQWGVSKDEWETSFEEDRDKRHPKLETGFWIRDVISKLWQNAEFNEYRTNIPDIEIESFKTQFDAVIRTFALSSDREKYAPYSIHVPVIQIPCAPHNLKAKMLAFLKKEGKDPKYASDLDGLCVYNGSYVDSYVRHSFLHESESIEYSMSYSTLASGPGQRIRDLHPETPPIKDRIVDNELIVGRWATFERKYISDQAYSDTKHFLENL